MEDSVAQRGDRVRLTKAIRCHTHDGVFWRQPGLEGVVEFLHDDGAVNVDFGRWSCGLRPDEVEVIHA